ncbi:MAG: aminopeptidase P family protein [Desulfobacterales bacterium]|nr:aminopeptidase P family protein [Desulfobacterales bacterium]
MAEKNIAALVIPSADPHQSEYVADHWQARKWISGFSGSAGTAVITPDRAGVWTDFRYWIQAEKELAGSGFELFKLGDSGVDSVEKWLARTLSAGDRVALPGEVFFRSQLVAWQKIWEPLGIAVETQWDPVAELWEDRPPLPGSKAWDFSVAYAGRSRPEKLEDLRSKMIDLGADHYLITRLEDLAWAFNLRGNDVETNPVNVAYGLVGLESARIFVDPDKMDPALVDTLAEDGIACEPYDRVAQALSELPGDAAVLVEPEAVNLKLWNALPENGRKIEEKIPPATQFKAVKNGVEIAHLRETAVKDGVAMVSFLHWLEDRVNSGEGVTELEAGEKVKEFRMAQEGFVDNSFSPIMAQGPHSAMCHYSADPESNARITTASLFLNDSGGNYLTGTTDITRTLCFGEPTPSQKRDYTLVLKGHIALSTSRFPQGTRGCQLDTLARHALWQEGMDFGHGTGHGVGFFLCVHEGPARISPFPVDVALKPGMLLTNEPGLYREGEYGIRLENMILVQEDTETVFGKFLGFENLTLCPFERALMDEEFLEQAEVEWINAYHEEVWEALSPHVSGEVKSWLRVKTGRL